MDACYQPSQSFNGSSFDGTNEVSTIYGATTSCPDGADRRPATACSRRTA